VSFPDHFSGHADAYSRHRPTYPAELYAWLAGLVEWHDVAWDCGTGSGQAAVGLADRFEHVVATDASPQQIRRARRHPGVSYVVAAAETPPLAHHAVALVTVAQAVHWFDLEAFYAEVRRVGRPGGILAVWTYSVFTVDPDVDDVVGWYYRDIVGPYWPRERWHVEDRYRNLPFPFDNLETDPSGTRGLDAAPAFSMRPSWRREDVVAQLGTWSSTNRYRDVNGADPLDILRPRLAEVWPDDDEHRLVDWPLYVKVGRL
jgi:SAM-dependent methyltransferase